MEFDARTYAVIGAAQEVHTVLGCGYLERVYQLALANELRRRGIPFEAEVEAQVVYKGDRLDCHYRFDLLCFGEVLVELKALPGLGPVEESQVLNYLKAGPLDVGLLLNFGAPRLEVRRYSSARLLSMKEQSPSVPSVPSVTSVD